MFDDLAHNIFEGVAEEPLSLYRCRAHSLSSANNFNENAQKRRQLKHTKTTKKYGKPIYSN